jgi:hypothetical protein
MTTEQERKDRIVAAAEELTRLEDELADCYERRSIPEGLRGKISAAKTAVREACKPIEPPYKPLLSNGCLDALFESNEEGCRDFWRQIGAATLEAVADGPYTCDHCAEHLRDIAKKERDHG